MVLPARSFPLSSAVVLLPDRPVGKPKRALAWVLGILGGTLVLIACVALGTGATLVLRNAWVRLDEDTRRKDMEAKIKANTEETTKMKVTSISLLKDSERKYKGLIDLENGDQYSVNVLVGEDGHKFMWETMLNRRGDEDRQPIGDMTVTAFLVKRPPGSKKIRARARLSRYYNYRYRGAQETHYSILLASPNNTEFINAWVAKKSPAGERLFEILDDGHTRVMTLELSWIGPDGQPTPANDNEGIAILSIVKDH
jgi:hypothetical protein